MTKKTSSLEIKKVNPVIVESELGKDVIDKVTYKMESVEPIEELWGALNHPSTNVMKLLVQMIEEIQPEKYPTEGVLEIMGLRMVKVLGLSPEEVKIVALHNFFSIGLQAIPMQTLQIVGEDKPACFTIDDSLEKNTVRMFYKQKGMEETEMGMAINVMSMFKFLHGITKANVQIAQMIGEICKVWNIQTEWMGWEFVDEENTDQQQEIMKMLNIQRTTIMARQLRPEIAIRANGRVFMDTVLGVVTLPNHIVYEQKPLGKSKALASFEIMETQWKKELESKGWNHETLFEEDDCDVFRSSGETS